MAIRGCFTSPTAVKEAAELKPPKGMNTIERLAWEKKHKKGAAAAGGGGGTAQAEKPQPAAAQERGAGKVPQIKHLHQRRDTYLKIKCKIKHLQKLKININKHFPN